MKCISFILISLFFISCSKNNGSNPAPPSAPPDTLATGWKKVTLPALQSAIDIFFINNTMGFVAGGNFISRSTDGGNTWQKVYQSSYSFDNIAMGSALNAVFVTSATGTGSSKLIMTFDGGNSFDSVAIADGFITDAFFVSPTVAYAIGQKCWKTTDGGHNWISIYDFGSGAGNYRSLHFLNEQTGWWAGGGGVFNTTNAGINWNSQPVSAFNFSITGEVFFIDANNGYVADYNSIGKTTNGGTSWTKIYTLQGGYHDLHFLTSAIGYVSDNQYIRKTIDGGNTWTKEVRLAGNAVIELHFTDADHGWASVSAGYILKYER